MVEQAEGRQWCIEYAPQEQKNWHWGDSEKLGTYTVCINAADAKVLSCDWSHQDVALHAYTEHTFGAAPAFNATMLPWVQALLEDLQIILDKYDSYANLDDMTLEDHGAYDARMRDAGYPAVQNPALIPQQTDLPKEEAAKLVLDALHALYGSNDRVFVRGEEFQERLSMSERPDGSWMRVWSIAYADNTDVFTVEVNAETGEIENLWHDSTAFGNGWGSTEST